MGERNRSNTPALTALVVARETIVTPYRQPSCICWMTFSRDARLALVAGLFAFGCLVFFGQANAAPETRAAGISKEATEKAPTAIAWKKVPAAEKSILAPLEPQWSILPGHQQRKLLGAAKHYPKLTPIEQERFQERLRSWSSLTPAQRADARDKYQSLTNLPAEKQQEIKARWQQEKSNAATPAAPSSPPPPPAK